MQTNVDRAIIGYVTEAFRKDKRSMPQYPNKEIFDMMPCCRTRDLLKTKVLLGFVRRKLLCPIKDAQLKGFFCV